MAIIDIKPGGWSNGEKLTSGQMNNVRGELIKCVDGSGGGTYTPSGQLTLNNTQVALPNNVPLLARNAADTADLQVILLNTSNERVIPSILNVTTAINNNRPVFNYCVAIRPIRGSAQFPLPTADSPIAVQTTTSSSFAEIAWEFTLPPGVGSLVSVKVAIDPKTGRAGLPNNRPQAAVIRRRLDTSTGAITQTNLGAEIDTSATLGAYETPHYITITPSPTDVLVNDWLQVILTGEYGTNSQPGLEANGVVVSYNTDTFRG